MRRTKFKPKPGQVDFSKARFAPVINCVLKSKGKILLVKRSRRLNFYPGFWNGISGFLDDRRTLLQKVKDEIREELGWANHQIKKVRLAGIFHQAEPKYRKIWIIHAVLVEVVAHRIKLNWEAEDFVWTTFEKTGSFQLLPSFKKVLKAVRRLLKSGGGK